MTRTVFPPNGMSWIGLILLGSFLSGALLAPWVSPADPKEIRLEEALSAPSRTHPFGTDQLGRDVLARILYGARISLGIGFLAVGLATGIGVAVGTIAGTQGGWVDWLAMRVVDILFCFPTLFLILAAVAFLEPGVFHLMAIIGLTGWMGLARLVRAEILTLKERDFVQAARAIGASGFRIIVRHLLPNAMAPILVSIPLGIGSAILLESGLSFLGIGIQPPTPSWGNILSEGKATLGVAWWLTIVPGAAIFFTVLGCHFLAEGLRRAWRTP